jgi:hypothetical protein
MASNEQDLLGLTRTPNVSAATRVGPEGILGGNGEPPGASYLPSS